MPWLGESKVGFGRPKGGTYCSGGVELAGRESCYVPRHRSLSLFIASYGSFSHIIADYRLEGVDSPD